MVPRVARYTMIQLLTLDTWADDIARWVIGVHNPETHEIVDGVFYYCLFFVFFIGIGVFVFWNLITAIIVETAFAISDSDANSQARETLGLWEQILFFEPSPRRV